MDFDYSNFIKDKEKKKKEQSNRLIRVILLLLVALSLGGVFLLIYFGIGDLNNLTFIADLFVAVTPHPTKLPAQEEAGAVQEGPVAVGPQGEIYEGDVDLILVNISYLTTGEMIINLESQEDIPIGEYPALVGVVGGEIFEYHCNTTASSPKRLFCRGEPIKVNAEVNVIILQQESVTSNINILNSAGMVEDYTHAFWSGNSTALNLTRTFQEVLDNVQVCVDGYTPLSGYVVNTHWDGWNAIAYLENAFLRYDVPLLGGCEQAQPELNILDSPEGAALDSCYPSLVVGAECAGLEVHRTDESVLLIQDFDDLFGCLKAPATCGSISVLESVEYDVDSGLLSQAQTCAASFDWAYDLANDVLIMALRDRLGVISSSGGEMTTACQAFLTKVDERQESVALFSGIFDCIQDQYSDLCERPFHSGEDYDLQVTLYQQLVQGCAEDIGYASPFQTISDYAELTSFLSAGIPWIGEAGFPNRCRAIVNFSAQFGYSGYYEYLLADVLKGRVGPVDRVAYSWSKVLVFEIPLVVCPEGLVYDSQEGICVLAP
jgi:hypothetical protein